MQCREAPFHKRESQPRFDKPPRAGLASRRPMKPSIMPAALDDLFVVRGDMA
jgi:hypothetical protein